MTIKAGIIGGAGYTGGELLRLLVNHPQVVIAFVHSKSSAGKPVHTVHGDLLGETDLCFTGEWSDAADVLFLCAGHGEAKRILAENPVDARVKIIDLSQDFRLLAAAGTGSREFVYGLPELNREAIRTAANIANPGCFATAIQLGLLPLAKAGLLSEVHTTGITGSTGAGQSLTATSHFSWRANNVQAYKTLNHQHLNEIHQSLNLLQPGYGKGVHFVPWRGDFTRGIFVTSYTRAAIDLAEAQSLYQAFYTGHPFVKVSSSMIDLKQVVNTNNCFLYIEQVDNQIVVHTIIDNLLKGASGQAVQNMNLLFGLEETAGLKLKANYF